MGVARDEMVLRGSHVPRAALALEGKPGLPRTSPTDHHGAGRAAPRSRVSCEWHISAGTFARGCCSCGACDERVRVSHSLSLSDGRASFGSAEVRLEKFHWTGKC